MAAVPDRVRALLLLAGCGGLYLGLYLAYRSAVARGVPVVAASVLTAVLARPESR